MMLNSMKIVGTHINNQFQVSFVWGHNSKGSSYAVPAWGKIILEKKMISFHKKSMKSQNIYYLLAQH